jgi:hypothetical protein
MPALQALARRWAIASDDMPGPASAGVVFHFHGIILYAVALAGIQQTVYSENCDHIVTRYQAFYALLLAISVLLTVVLVALWHQSSQGRALMTGLNSAAMA